MSRIAGFVSALLDDLATDPCLSACARTALTREPPPIVFRIQPVSGESPDELARQIARCLR